MSQCVPSWDLDDPPNPSHLLPSSSAHTQLSMSGYEVAELAWVNGHLSTHGLVKPTPKYPPSAAGTLESVVDQAKLLQPSSSASWQPAGPRNNHHLPPAVDALVPTHRRQREDLASGIGSCEAGVSAGRKRARVGDTGTATARSTDSTRVADDCGTDDFGLATTNSVTPFPDNGNAVSGSPDTENTSFGGSGGSRPMTVADDHGSVFPSRRSLSQKEMVIEDDEKITEGDTMRSTISTKRDRASAIHNQSERKRRDRINQKMRTLQKLVPNSSKTDKASMLDEVIEYLKQLQAQVQMMSRMSSTPPMMMPMTMQQFQMTMMAQMAQMAQIAQMGMGMGMGMMDMSSIGRTGPAGVSPVLQPPAFLPMIGAGSWDPTAADRMQQPTGAFMPDPMFSAFVACQPQQQMTMDAYQRMAAMFQQTQPTNPK